MFKEVIMRYIFAILFLMSTAYASEFIKPAANTEQAVVAGDGIDFNEWESDFDHSIEKAQVKVRKCEKNSKNCQFEKFQALDPDFDMVH